MAKRERPSPAVANKVLNELKFHRKVSSSNVTPSTREANKVLNELKFHRKVSPSNIPRKVIKKEPSVAASESSGLSHLAGDVDRWIHGSRTTVPPGSPPVSSHLAGSLPAGASHLPGSLPAVASHLPGSLPAVTSHPPGSSSAVASNVTLKNPAPMFRTAGVQSSRHQNQRPTMVSGVSLAFGPCYALGLMLLDLETRAGGRSVAAIVSLVRFLASQLHQVCAACALDVQRAMQMNLSPEVFAARICALAMDALLVAYALGFIAFTIYQTP